MTDAEILASLEPVPAYQPACVVPTTLRVLGQDVPDDSSWSPARPLDARAREQLREQQIARLTRDEAAVKARERRIAIEGGKVADIRRWSRR